MKKVFSFLLALVIMISTVSSTAFAVEIVFSGTCGESLTWALDDEGTLSILGEGAMDSYMENGEAIDTPWEEHKENIKNVVITKGVTNIGNGAFYYSYNLSSVTISDTVKSIGEYAFYDCAIESIDIPSSVTTIGNDAFYFCSRLKSVTIPSSVTTIGDYAFYGCEQLKELTLPNSITTIGRGAFYFCEDLESINIPDNVTIINDYTFCECWSLKSITLPKSITSIGDYAFYYCEALESITIPDSVTSIGSSAFFFCRSLTSVTIPDSVTTIKENAFESCWGLESVTIPDSVTTIGKNAFIYCSALKSVTIPESVTTIEDHAFGYYVKSNVYNKIEGFTITGVKGSEAERYATENEFAFNPIDITTLPDNDYFLNKEDSTMPNLVADTLVSDLISTLEEYGITATVTDKDGNVLEGTKKVGTNCKVITPDGEYVVIVTGDVTGDGTVSTTDYLQIKLSLSIGEGLEGYYYKAADCDNDGNLTSVDYLKLKSYFLGNFDLYA